MLRDADGRSRPLPWLLAAGGVALAYTVLRAASVAFTYDESLTLRLVERPLYEIVTLTKPIANNHVLNTLLIKLARAVFGGGELVYRLPNLAAHALYLGLAIALARRARGTVQALAAFAALAASPYLLDYFSLARGYGLAMAFALAACLTLLEFERAPEDRWAAGALAASTLAVLSSFAFLGFHVALTGALVVVALRRRGAGLKQAALVAAGGCVVTLAAVRPLGKLFRAGELYYGGHTSFVSDTVGSLAAGLAYGAPYAGVLVPIACVLCVAVLVATALTRAPGSQLLLGVVTAQVAIAFVQHAVTGTPWPLGRTALPFLIPLLVMAARLVSAAPGGLAAALAILLAGHALVSANLTSALDWRYSADVKTALRAVAAAPAPVRLLVSWPLEESARFYVREWDLRGIDCEVAEFVPDPGRFDFYYLLAEDQPFGFVADPAQLDRPGRRVVRAFPLSRTYLLESP